MAIGVDTHVHCIADTALIVTGCYIIIIGILWYALTSSSCVDFNLIILVYVGMCRT